jgi:branched-chain amino acid transport system permease protein
VNRSLYKVLAFGVSAAYAGVAGSLYAIIATFVSPDTFPITLSLLLLVGAVVGWYGSIWGAVVGALLIQFLPDVVDLVPRVDTKQPGRATFFFGAILVAVMIYARVVGTEQLTGTAV